MAFVAPSDIVPGAATFLIIGIGAFSLPIVARGLRAPPAVLEIIYGILVGPSVLRLVATDAASEGFTFVLAEVGLLLLMFLAGFEIDFARLERDGRGPVVVALLYFGIVSVVAWFGFGLVGLDSIEQHLFMTLLVAAASLGIIIPTLRSAGAVATKQGQVVLVVGAIAEVAAALGLVLLGVAVQHGYGIRLLSVPAFVLVVMALLVFMRRLAWWFPEKAERLFRSEDPDEMGIRASLALLFVLVGLSLALGIDPILGAFFAGAAFVFVFRDTGTLKTRLSGIAFGFFIPVFFISVGIRFPLEALGDVAVLTTAVAVIVVAIVAKMLPSPILMLRRIGVHDALRSGVLLSGQLSVAIALAEFGVQLGILDEGLEAGAILLVGVTAVGVPLVYGLIAPEPRPRTAERPRT
ncbi:MAG: cation:proton antiporter [Acidimicrobiia bacterium]